MPGIDALLIGTNDLCFELGIPGQFDDACVAEAYRRVIAACRRPLRARPSYRSRGFRRR
ncbi:MAG: hypothetical protein ACRDN8_09865, partial [Thermoleophilaceae bacterium]